MILTILKYLGLCLAATSSIWGITHELTTKTADNRKRLTKAGIISILFVAIGLILSIVSDDIGRRLAAKEQYAKVAEEAKRTNEITIASQPLTSLLFVLHFESSDTGFRKKMEEGQKAIQENNESSQGGVTRFPFDYMEYKAGLIPMLEFLARLGDSTQEHSAANENNGADSNGILALIPLDGSPNAILSFGDIHGEPSWDDKDSTQRLSAGISPARAVTSSPITTSYLSVDSPSQYDITWNLDPVSLESSIARANPSIRSGAKLPQVLNMVILRIADRLPFAQNNFALTGSGLWYTDPKQVKHVIRNVSNMTLSVTVNGFSELEYLYKLSSVYNKSLYDDFGDEIEIGCTVFEFRLN